MDENTRKATLAMICAWLTEAFNSDVEFVGYTQYPELFEFM